MRNRRLIAVGIVLAVVVGGLVLVQCQSSPDGSATYHCPMHPTYTSDKPGNCPICGMTLVPIKEHEHQEKTSPTSQLPARTAITVTDRQRQLIGLTTTAVQKMELVRELRTLGEVAYDPTLTSSAGKVWINVTLYESDIGLVRVGHSVVVSLPDRPATLFSGTIAAMAPLVDRETRTLRARAEVADPQGLLLPARFVDVRIQMALGEGLAVPASAVLENGAQTYAFVDQGEGKLEPRNISVGAWLREETIEILSGLEEGERVVTSANFLIDSESALRAAVENRGHAH